MNTIEKDIKIPADHAGNIFGEFDCHLKKIEKTLNVSIIMRDDQVKIIGDARSVEKTIDVKADI